MVKNKKAVSAIVGYVLLVSFGVIMAVIVFNYLQTYVPKDLGSCPDGTSMFLKDYAYNCTSGQLNISLKNNGKFNIAGFFINGANDSDVKIATIDLSKNIDNEDTKLYGSAIVPQLGNENLIRPNHEQVYVFENLNSYGDLKIIEIIPMRFQEDNGRIRPVSCSQTKIRETLGCN